MSPEAAQQIAVGFLRLFLGIIPLIWLVRLTAKFFK